MSPDEFDALAISMVPVATEAVMSARDWDRGGFGAQLDVLGRQELYGLIVVLSAMVPDDVPLGDLLAWVEGHAAVKRCRTCRVDKPRIRFSLDKSRADGLRGDCKDCHRATRERAESARGAA